MVEVVMTTAAVVLPLVVVEKDDRSGDGSVRFNEGVSVEVSGDYVNDGGVSLGVKVSGDGVIVGVSGDDVNDAGDDVSGDNVNDGGVGVRVSGDSGHHQPYHRSHCCKQTQCRCVVKKQPAPPFYTQAGDNRIATQNIYQPRHTTSVNG